MCYSVEQNAENTVYTLCSQHICTQVGPATKGQKRLYLCKHSRKGIGGDKGGLGGYSHTADSPLDSKSIYSAGHTLAGLHTVSSMYHSIPGQQNVAIALFYRKLAPIYDNRAKSACTTFHQIYISYSRSKGRTRL